MKSLCRVLGHRWAWREDSEGLVPVCSGCGEGGVPFTPYPAQSHWSAAWRLRWYRYQAKILAHPDGYVDGAQDCLDYYRELLNAESDRGAA